MKEYSLEDCTVRPTPYDDINDIFTEENLTLLKIAPMSPMFRNILRDAGIVLPIYAEESNEDVMISAYAEENLTATKAAKLLDGDKSCKK